MDYINKEDVIKWLKENLDEERFEHSIGVSETAVELAKEFGLDEKKPMLQVFYTIVQNVFHKMNH